MHIKYNKNFLLKLHVQLGKVLGWVKSKDDANEIFCCLLNSNTQKVKAEIEQAYDCNNNVIALNDGVKMLGLSAS